MGKSIKTGIAISGIDDRHKNKKPEVIECKSASELHEKLKNYLPKQAMPSYEWCLEIVKKNGYVKLLKTPSAKGFKYSL